MNGTKAALLGALALLALIMAFLFFKRDTDYELNAAYESFLKGNTDKALSELSRLKSSPITEQKLLYEAYVYRTKLQWQDANKALASAAEQARVHNQPTLLLEIYLNQALNGYLENNPEALRLALAKAELLAKQDPWVRFMGALQNYQLQQYPEALSVWTQSNTRLPLSGWMRKAFDDIFTPTWLSLHIARAEIETGKFLAARQRLQEELKNQPPEDPSELYFLIGLSYIKEAQSKPVGAAAPYYKLAFSYINRVPMQQKRFAEERQRLAEQIKGTIAELIQAHAYADLPFYITLLDAWNAGAERTEIDEKLLRLVNEELAAGHWSHVKELTSLLHRMLSDGEGREQIRNLFEKEVLHSLQEGHLEEANEAWEIVRLFSRNPSELAEQVTSQTTKQIFSILPLTDDSLKTLIPYLSFWRSVEKNREARRVFAFQMLKVAQEEFQRQSTPAKGLALMKTALTLPSEEDQEEVRKRLEENLNASYLAAISRDDLEQLKKVIFVVRSLGLENFHDQRQEEIPKQLARVEQLIAENQPEGALERLSWITTLDSNQPAALLLTGQLLYREGRYGDALKAFSRLSQPDPATVEKIAVSQLFAGNEKEGMQLLETLQKKGALSRESLLRVGFGLLTRGEETAGLKWLKDLPQADPQLVLALSFAAFQDKKWEEFSRLWQQLPPHYQKLDIAQGMKIESEIATQQTAKAEERLQALLASPLEKEQPNEERAFSLFKKNMAQLDRFLVAASFYQEVKADPETALKYLSLARGNAADVKVTKGKILLDLGRTDEAVQELQSAYQEAFDERGRRKVMPFLAEALAKQGSPLAALNMSRAFYALDPHSLVGRARFAELLMQLRRFDLAEAEYEQLLAKAPLTSEQLVEQLTSLVEVGRFEEANAFGKEALEEKKTSLSLADQLKVAREMIITENQQVTWPLLKRLPEEEKLSSPQAAALLQFLLQIGNYAQAKTLGASREAILSESVEGLSALAKLYDRLGERERALTFAELALKKSPQDAEIPESLQESASVLADLSAAQAQFDGDPANPDKILKVAGKMAAALRLPKNNLSKQEIQRIGTALAQLAEKVPGIPEISFLQGEMQRHLGNAAAAIPFYLNAASLSPSYVAPLMALADLYKAQGDTKRVISILYQVTRYAPDHAGAWSALAAAYAGNGYLHEASNFYQNAIKFRPNGIDNYIALGKVLLQLRNPEDARVVLFRATQLQADNVEVLKLLLTALFDSAFFATGEEAVTLAKERKDVMERLRKASPQEAERFIGQLQKAAESTGNFNIPVNLKENPLFFPEPR